jgi:mediator of RNA polymerase II transcription subunit 12
MPVTGLSTHLLNLRRTLLRGTVYSVDAEEQLVATTQAAIYEHLSQVTHTQFSSSLRPMVDVDMLSPTARLEVAMWLRQQVAANAEQVDWYGISLFTRRQSLTVSSIPTRYGTEVSGPVCRISSLQFQAVRTYLEHFDDLAILADVIGVVATSFDSSVLCAAADTLHHNYVAFRAIGAFEALFDRIAMRYTGIRTVQFPERELLHSLIDLSRTAQADSELMQLLSYDMSRYDQKNTLAVCSPVSDTMIEGGAPLDVEDEIERILQSGTSMDQQMMSRVFGKIVTYLDRQLCKGKPYAESFAPWIYRLRSFEESTFDSILSSWLRTLMITYQPQLLNTAVPLLVASGSLTLAQFLATVRECTQGRDLSQLSQSYRIANDGLERILPCTPLFGACPQQDLYRYRLEQYKFCRQRNGGLLDLVRDVIELHSLLPNLERPNQPPYVVSDERLLDVVRHLAIVDVQNLSTLTAFRPQGPSMVTYAISKVVFDLLLDPIQHLSKCFL